MRAFAVLIMKAVVSVGVLLLLLHHFDLKMVRSVLGHVRPWVLATAVLVLALASLLPALRWRVVLQALDVRLNVWPIVRLSLIGSFFNQILPSGVGGDLVRAWHTTHHQVEGKKAAESVLSDRILGLAILVLQSLAAFPFLGRLHLESEQRYRLAVILGVMTLGFGFFLCQDFLFRKRVLNLTNNTRFFRQAFSQWFQLGKLVRKNLCGFPDNIKIMIYSLLNQIICATVLHLLMLECGVRVTLWTTLALFPFVAIIGMLPISFANWGVREGAMILIFSMVGVPREMSLGASVLYGIAVLMSTVFGCILWLLRFFRLVKSVNENIVGRSRLYRIP